MTRLVPAPAGLERVVRSAQARATAKGARIERLALSLFESRGCLVERAPKVVIWQAVRRPDGSIDDAAARMPRTAHHDFFGLWDFVVIEPVGSYRAGVVRFAQVTTVENVSSRRRKILSSDWPARADDLLLGYAGRGVFRVWPGPTYAIEAAPLKTPPRRRAK